MSIHFTFTFSVFPLWNRRSLKAIKRLDVVTLGGPLIPDPNSGSWRHLKNFAEGVCFKSNEFEMNFAEESANEINIL